MKQNRLIVIALVTAAATGGPAYGQNTGYGSQTGLGDEQPGYQDYDHDGTQGPRAEVGFFYDELSPYGEWVHRQPYGWAWFPRGVRADWRPYAYGRWVDSQYGWTWISDEPFGWATYHYGRWAWDREIGWVWVPGTVWGPAWVAWQQGGGYVGWAPLPPEVGFENGGWLRLDDLDLSTAMQPSRYTFVEEHQFLEQRVERFILSPARNGTIIDGTVNNGVPVELIERAIGRAVHQIRISAALSAAGSGGSGDDISIYQPPNTRLQTVRAPRAAYATPATIQRQQRLEQAELMQQEDVDRRQLEKVHQREMTQSPDQVSGQEVARRHATELQLQEQGRQSAEQQLRARQQITRRAAASAEKPRKMDKADGKDKGSDGNGEHPPPPSF
jgi:hypothetical protein